MSDLSAAPRWIVLVPVKSTAVGKSRLALPPAGRAALARALAQDTVTAVARTPLVARVVVLVEDPADGRRLALHDTVEPLRVRAHGLNEAIGEALAGLDPTDGPVAVLPGDLPSLRSAELGQALALAATHPRSVVPDRQGTGTTLLAALRADLMTPRYGIGSFAAHRAAGAVPLPVDPGSGLRRDVDTVEDLAGVTGAATRAVLTRLAVDTSA